MSIKDDINKGFTIGDVTTANYDSEAKIKVKEYYELDKLERSKLLELAGQIDIELAKRDIKIEELEEKIDNSSGGNTGDGIYTYYPPKEMGYYVLYKKVIPKSEIDEKCLLTLDKYNALSGYEKFNVDSSLEELGFELPVTLEKVKAYITGKPTGYGAKNLMYICMLFSECIELPTNLNIEYYKTDFKSSYITETMEYYKLFLPKLTVFIGENKELIISEREAMGKWSRIDGNRTPMYNTSACPMMVRYNFNETGDCEISVVCNADYSSNYVLRANVEAELIGSQTYSFRYLIPITDFNVTIIFHNSVLSYIPVNINYYLSDIEVDKIRLLSFKNSVGNQVNEANIQFMVLEDITITADSYSDKRIKVLKNLNFRNIEGKKEIILISGSETVKAELTYSELTIIVPKGETITLKKNNSYVYKGSVINTLQ